MSDISPEEQPQPPRARRATRPKTKASTPRRAMKPEPSLTSAQSDTRLTPSEPEEAPADDGIETAPESVIGQPELETSEPAAPAPRSIKIRDMTLLSRPILLWAVIVGFATIVLTFGPGLVLTALGVTQKDLDSNPSLSQGLGCGSLILSLALPFVGGWRATLREGTWKEGGITGAWSAIAFILFYLIIVFIFAAAGGQLDKVDGNFFAGLLEGLVFQMFLSFGLGAMGGFYSTWQRRRAEQKQELLTSSS